MVTSAELGRIGEELAVRHLRRSGLVVLTRNWRCTRPDLRGELDVVARDGDVLVFCEVKTRHDSTTGGPAAAVTPAKQRRLRRLAAAYLASTPTPRRSLRFDVIAVTWPGPGHPAHVHHLRGVC